MVTLICAAYACWYFSYDGISAYLVARQDGGLETRYAPDYDEMAFRGIAPGMGKDEVRALLGEPLRVDAAPTNAWIYTASDTSASWWRLRMVWFERGRVVAALGGIRSATTGEKHAHSASGTKLVNHTRSQQGAWYEAQLRNLGVILPTLHAAARAP